MSLFHLLGWKEKPRRRGQPAIMHGVTTCHCHRNHPSWNYLSLLRISSSLKSYFTTCDCHRNHPSSNYLSHESYESFSLKSSFTTCSHRNHPSWNPPCWNHLILIEIIFHYLYSLESSSLEPYFTACSHRNHHCWNRLH